LQRSLQVIPIRLFILFQSCQRRDLLPQPINYYNLQYKRYKINRLDNTNDPAKA
jgi:hypothetical protein